MLKACLHCGVEFYTRHSTVQHCSIRCGRRTSAGKAPTLTCSHCGKQFERTASRIAARQTAESFCSYGCHISWRRDRRIPRPCEVCGKTLPGWQKHYCSKPCADLSQRKYETATCQHCERVFETFPSATAKGRKYCSVTCSRAAMTGPMSAHWRGGVCDQKGRFWERIRARVLERDKTCLGCDAERSPNGRRLDVHHIDPRRNYQDVDDANIMGNLVALCAVCHGRIEMTVKYGPAQSLPTRLRVLASLR